MPARFFLGLDLGQAADYTALAVIEAPAHEPLPWPRTEMLAGGPPDETDREHRIYRGPGGRRLPLPPRAPTVPPAPEPVFSCRHLDRLPLGTAYVRVVEAHVAPLVSRLATLGEVTLVVDQTGVGQAVIDMLRAWGLCPHGITIHGGDAVTQHGRDFRVPKRDLIGNLQVLLQQRRLSFAKDLVHAPTLVHELQAYQVAFSSVGHDSYSARSGAHDDLLLAVAIAAWLAVRWTSRPKAAHSPEDRF